MRKTGILVVFGVALIMLSVPFVSAEQVHIQYKLPNNLASIPDWLNVTANYTISNHKLVFNQFGKEKGGGGLSFDEILLKTNNTSQVKKTPIREVSIWHNFTISLSNPINPDVFYPPEETHNYGDGYYISLYIYEPPMGTFSIQLSTIADNLNTNNATEDWIYGVDIQSSFTYKLKNSSNDGQVNFPETNYMLPRENAMSFSQMKYLLNHTIIQTNIVTLADYIYSDNSARIRLYFKYDLSIANQTNNKIYYKTSKSVTYAVNTNTINSIPHIKDYTLFLSSVVSSLFLKKPYPATQSYPHRSLTVNSLTMDITEGNITNNGGNNNNENNTNPIIGSKVQPYYPLTYNMGMILGIVIITMVIATDIYIHRKFP